jgi:hypothetical protein
VKQIKDTFNFDRRASLMYGDRMGQQHFLWTETLASDAGMHFHVWIPKVGVQAENDIKDLFKRATKRERDAVSFSWDYVPTDRIEYVSVKTTDELPSQYLYAAKLTKGQESMILVTVLKQQNRESECPA